MSKDDNILKISELAVSERPRERLLHYGASTLSATELLAIIISSGTKSESALALANRVMALEGGDLSKLSLYRPEEFQKISGIGIAVSCKIAAAIELGKRVASYRQSRTVLSTPAEVFAYCDDMRRLQKEVFRALYLNCKQELIGREDVSVGNVISASASPREVFTNAVRIGAYAIILIHNHPSGDPSPSAQDIQTTQILQDAGELLGIKVVDHVIVGENGYYSFRENNP